MVGWSSRVDAQLNTECAPIGREMVRTRRSTCVRARAAMRARRVAVGACGGNGRGSSCEWQLV